MSAECDFAAASARAFAEGAQTLEAFAKKMRAQFKGDVPDEVIQAGFQNAAERYRKDYKALDDIQAELGRTLTREAGVRQPLWKKILTVSKAGMFTSPAGRASDPVFNALGQVVEDGMRIPAAMADMAVYALQGGSLNPNAQRTVTMVNPASWGRTVTKAAIEGAREAKEIWKKGVVQGDRFNEQDALAKLGVDTREFYAGESRGGKILSGYVNGVFRTMTAADRFTRIYAYHRSLEAQASSLASLEAKQARAQGDPPVNVKERVKFLRENPTDVMKAIAVGDAEVAVFSNENALSTIADRAKYEMEKRGAVGATGYIATDLIMPVSRTPSNIAMRALEYAGGPLTMTGATGRALIKAMNKQWSPAEQKRFSETFGRGATGPLLIALGYKMAEAGLLTGYAGDAKEFVEKEKEGRVPSALYINGKYYEIGRVPILGALLSTGATFYEQSQKGQTPSMLGTAVIAAKGAAGDLPFIESAQSVAKIGGNLIKAGTEPKEKNRDKAVADLGKDAAGMLAGRVVPSAVSQGLASMDPNKRESKGFKETMAARTGIGRQSLPVKRRKDGTPVPQPKSVYDPFKSVPGNPPKR